MPQKGRWLSQNHRYPGRLRPQLSGSRVSRELRGRKLWILRAERTPNYGKRDGDGPEVYDRDLHGGGSRHRMCMRGTRVRALWARRYLEYRQQVVPMDAVHETQTCCQDAC